MPTRQMHVTIPPALEAAARANRTDLADAPTSVLVRAGLAVLAGIAVSQVASQYRTQRVPDGVTDLKAEAADQDRDSSQGLPVTDVT